MNTRSKSRNSASHMTGSRSDRGEKSGGALADDINGFHWRPQQTIQTKVIGVCINRRRLLAAEVYDDAGEIKGVRPLGGHVEFGETREQALQREFQEELGCGIVTSGNWRTFENMYQHEGLLGHEYIHAISIGLVDKSLYEQPLMVFSEDSGSHVRARWFNVRDLRSGALALFPDGLAATL